MDQATHNKIVCFLWGIADDVLRDLFKRGKYPDVILPMCVIRRLDAVLEPTKKAVLSTKEMLDRARITAQDAALADAAKQAFYNTSKFTLRDLRSRGSQQQLLADFEDYLNGFSPNVQDIIENFKFRNQVTTLSRADALGTLINKFLDPDIDLSPSAIDNHAMGTIFEELVRRFNEENNEEAGEHWTPRDAVRLMANLVFLPIQDRIKSGTYLLYDGACGTGGMLTLAEETLAELASKDRRDVKCLLYGQEINPETYAVCKADILLKGEGESADHIVGGAEWSTLAHDAFPAQEFDFMLSNPPYGKSWKKDLEDMGGKDAMRDPRFKVMHEGEELSLVTRSSDGQMLFLANMASKMNEKSPLGSRFAEVHNGSSLFTGDAGQGESNIRRWLIENDWLEAIVALPLNLFYNTGIATYIWVLTNRKPEHRKGKVQLIDASQWFKPLRKNLGKKNCELSADDIERITRTFLAFEETPESKIFPNAAFGYWKVTVERPLRLHSHLTLPRIEALRFASGDEEIRSALYDEFGDRLYSGFSAVANAVTERLENWVAGEADGDEDEESTTKKGLSEKKKKKLLDPKTWERDGKLVDLAMTLRKELGDELLEDHNLFRDRVKAIVAFSGEHEFGGEKATETSMNGFPGGDIADKIQEDPYRFLICADKFQTGYDEPLLHTMFVDKPLAVYSEALDENAQVEFKGKSKAFTRTYDFLASVMPYPMKEWEKLSIVLNLLIPKPPAPKEEDLSKGILDAIDMDSYRVEKKTAMSIALTDAEAEIAPVPVDGGSGKRQPELDKLSNIISAFNEHFGTLFTDGDRVVKRIREDIAPKVAADIAYQNAKKNTPNAARLEHDKALAKVMLTLLKDDTEVYKQFVENDSFQRFVTDMVYGMTNAQP